MLTIEEKIYGLSEIWKEASYNFPFWCNLGSLNWDEEYKKALAEVIQCDDLLDYYLILMKFISLLRDGHTNVVFPEEITNNIGSYPIWIDYLESGYHIICAEKKLQIPLPAEIVEINQMPVQDYINNKIYPYCWHEKTDSAASRINELLPYIEHGKDLNIKTTRGSYTLKPLTYVPEEFDVVRVECKEEFTELFHSSCLDISITKDQIAVIRIRNFMEGSIREDFYTSLHKMKDCAAYMIDIRYNSGGDSNNAYAVVQAFIEGAFDSSRDKKLIHIGPYKAWGQYIDFDNIDMTKASEWHKKTYEISTKQHFDTSVTSTRYEDCPIVLQKPLVVLTNCKTASAAEDFIVALDNVGRATIVGTPTYGSTGMPLGGSLPGGGSYRICTRWCTYPDGREFLNTGVQPTVLVEPTVEDYRNGYDRAFDKGLKVLRKSIS